MKIMERICLVGSSRFGLSNPFDCSVYLLDGGSELLLIDAGAGVDIQPILHNIETDGYDPEDISTIIVTHSHADHGGGCRDFKEKVGCNITVPEGDRMVIEGQVPEMGLEQAKHSGIYPATYDYPHVPVDRVYQDGERLKFGDITLHAIRVAGHHPHLMCLLLEGEDRRILFSSDAVFYGGSISLLNAPGCSLDDSRRDIHKLASLDVDVLLPGHGIFVLNYGQDHINRAIAYLEGMKVPPNFIDLCPKIIPEGYAR
ncbi:MAG: MBL fold metallo-hydrolase [Candidatus Bipolaricaulia bacterium]